MDPATLQAKHDAALPYDEYLNTGTQSQRENWTRTYDQVKLTDDQQQLVKGFVRKINIIGLAGIWCGDCAKQCPVIQRIADAHPERVAMRWVDRDEHADLQQQVRINAGNRVPVIIFCAEDYELVGWYGDRTLSQYRAIAARQLGPSCPLPGAPIDGDEMAAMTQDWVDQIERVHLLLRLSGRLRQKHGD